MDNASAAVAAKTIEDHNERRGWEIEDKAHGLVMLLGDLIEYADANGLDFDLEVESAREMIRDCR